MERTVLLKHLQI